jgi:hypothetical protein
MDSDGPTCSDFVTNACGDINAVLGQYRAARPPALPCLCPIGFSVGRTERNKLEEIPFLLVSDLPYAPRTIRETMPLWANAFDNHVRATGFQSNNVSGLKLAVHFSNSFVVCPDSNQKS